MLTPGICDTLPRKANLTSTVRPREHIDQLVHLAPLLAAVTACDRGLDAVADMILQDFLLDSPQRSAYCRDLRDDVDAIAVSLDHAGDSAHLALDPVEAAKA
jgi:hypothetical protein